MVGASISLVFNFYCLICGRLIFGFASGILTVASPRMIEEYLPLHLCSFGVATYISVMATGASVSLFSAAFLPPTDDPVALKDSSVYFYIMAFPIPFYFVMGILLLTVIIFDSPKYYAAILTQY